MRRLADILEKPAGARVLVVGMARSGRAAACLLSRLGAQVSGTDRAAHIEGIDGLAAAGVDLELGGDRLLMLADKDLVVISPGVPSDAPMVRAAREMNLQVVGELELAFRLGLAPVLAVTGTNGKSTTTSLCGHLLQGAGFSTFVGGNLGLPLSEAHLSQERYERAVVEVSSFQLEHLEATDGFVPRVGVWLNLTPDHLDRHGDLATYTATKRRLFEGQMAGDTGIFFADDPVVCAAAQGLPGRRLFFGRDRSRLQDQDLWIDSARLGVIGGATFEVRNQRLRGTHNAENAAASVLAALAMGVPAASIQAGLDSFAGLPHRLEPIRELDGVCWINDSKGTNVDATMKSLTAFDEAVVLLAGGRGKGTDYRPLGAVVVERVRAVVLIGEEAKRIEEALSGCVPCHHAASMEEAVATCRLLARAGEVVLLSPACASFDMFQNFEHRGEVFRRLVTALGEEA